jgi:hypothetical protein
MQFARNDRGLRDLINVYHAIMKTVAIDRTIAKSRSNAVKPRSVRHRSAWKRAMRRSWLWIVPILAALSAIWIQAALHGFDANDLARQSTGRIEWRVAAPETAAPPANMGLPYPSTYQFTE